MSDVIPAARVPSEWQELLQKIKTHWDGEFVGDYCPLCRAPETESDHHDGCLYAEVSRAIAIARLPLPAPPGATREPPYSDLSWVVSNCYMLARREIRRLEAWRKRGDETTPVGMAITTWEHIVRFCETRAPECCQSSVLRSTDRRVAPPGAEEPAPQRAQDTYPWGETMPQYAVLGIGVEAWVELQDIEKRGIRQRNNDHSGMSISWRTLLVVMAVLRAIRLEDFEAARRLGAEDPVSPSPAGGETK